MKDAYEVQEAQQKLEKQLRDALEGLGEAMIHSCTPFVESVTIRGTADGRIKATMRMMTTFHSHRR